MQLVLFSILNFSLDQHFIIATRFKWEYFYYFDISLNVHKVDSSHACYWFIYNYTYDKAEYHDVYCIRWH